MCDVLVRIEGLLADPKQDLSWVTTKRGQTVRNLSKSTTCLSIEGPLNSRIPEIGTALIRDPHFA